VKYILAHAEARRRAVQGVQDAPDGYVIRIDEPTRSSAENRLLHSLVNTISNSVEWAGKKRSAEIWKRLLVAAWCRTIGEPVEILPAIDGHGVDIVPARTSKLTKKECADLIEFIYSWGAENAIMWPAMSGESNNAKDS
jgi:NinB protein